MSEYQPTGTTRHFGITSSTSGLQAGVIANSLTHNETVEVAEARNEKGQIIDLAPYSKGEEMTIDGLFISDAVAPGVKITVGDKDYLVTSNNKTESNTDFQRASLNCRTADEAVIWELSGFFQD